jgi:hypothetical protein
MNALTVAGLCITVIGLGVVVAGLYSWFIARHMVRGAASISRFATDEDGRELDRTFQGAGRKLVAIGGLGLLSGIGLFLSGYLVDTLLS